MKQKRRTSATEIIIIVIIILVAVSVFLFACHRNGISYALTATAAIVILYEVFQIRKHGLFYLSHKWVRDAEKEICLMYRDERFRGVDILSVSDHFRNECLDFLRIGYMQNQSPHEKRIMVTYFSSQEGVYMMVATRAYRKLLSHPFACYSALSWNQKRAYEAIFDCAFERLIQLKVYTSEDKSRADRQLKKVEEFCDQLKRSGDFMEW